jgi:hypothetical protein
MKKTIITALLVLVIGVVGVGFYRSWFTLSSPGPDTGPNKVNVNLTLDGDKMQEDASAVQKKTSELVRKVTEPAAPSGQKAPANQ